MHVQTGAGRESLQKRAETVQPQLYPDRAGRVISLVSQLVGESFLTSCLHFASLAYALYFLTEQLNDQL